MITRKTRTVMVEQEEVYEQTITCNMCAKAVTFSSDAPWDEDGMDVQEWVTIRQSGGYSSRYVGDGVTVQLHICQECFQQKICEQCVVEPTVDVAGWASEFYDEE